MKILHVITSLWTGGAEKLMVDLLPRFRDRGIEVDLLTFNGDRTAFRQDLEANGIKVYDFGTKGSMYSPIKLVKLIPFLRRYDIIHTHNTAPQLFAAIGSLFGGGQLITTEHASSNRRRNIQLFKVLDRWMFSRYKKVICISDIAKTNLLMHIGHSRADIVTINNGIDVMKYCNALSGKTLSQFAPASKKIVMVAGFRWEKDQDTLIKALQYLPDDFHLFLVGDGERRSVLEQLITSMHLDGRVHLLGVRCDIPNLLHEADYVVMSSHFEGLSLSSVEGMSVGKPFLASNVDGLREVVAGAGVLFTHGDAEGLAREIMKLDSNPNLYREVAARCFDRAQQFDISKMVEGYINIYKKQ